MPTITYKLNYYQFWTLSANWSSTERHSDYSMSYPVVKYTDYALSLDEFIEKYPTFTAETTGKAVSESTFGDVGKGHFGTLLFETILFKNSNYYYKHIVTAHKNAFSYDVGVEIGLGCKNDGKILYLRPFINGWINSVGAYTRTLEFGLGVTKITFYPKQS